MFCFLCFCLLPISSNHFVSIVFIWIITSRKSVLSTQVILLSRPINADVYCSAVHLARQLVGLWNNCERENLICKFCVSTFRGWVNALRLIGAHKGAAILMLVISLINTILAGVIMFYLVKVITE